MRGLKPLTVVFLAPVILCISYYLFLPTAHGHQEMSSGYMTLVNEQNRIILQTGILIHPGDQFIDEANNLYEVTTVEDTLARCRLIGSEPYTALEAIPTQAPAEATQPLIAVYHTHTDECYIPSDGKPSIRGKGSIMYVGEAFCQKLQELGYQTEHDKTLHDPHDANAYHRSRRTFMRLLNNGPSALFDIHRDSAPLNTYKTTINGQEATKILLVVGRQNQNRHTTLNFAKSLKAAADAKYRGLIRGALPI